MSRRKSVLVVGSMEDPVLAPVQDYLRAWGYGIVVLDPNDPGLASFVVSIERDAEGWIISNGTRVLLSDIHSVWYRDYGLVKKEREAQRELLSQECRAFIEREWRHFLGGIFGVLERRVWVNDPVAGRLASKPVQLRLAHKIGFSTPDTILSNDPSRLREFVDRCDGEVLYKPLWAPAIRLNKSADSYFAIVPQKVTLSDLENDKAVSVAPVMLQQLVDSVRDVRVTIIGRRVFAHSLGRGARTTIDWKYEDPEKIAWKRRSLGDGGIGEMCCELALRLGLNYGTVDFVEDVHGKIYFLELNPAGQYVDVSDGAVEHAVIAEMARLLAGHSPCLVRKIRPVARR